MDFVYLFKDDPEHESEELRYSLRSLQNIPHGNVFFAGEVPAWIQNVVHIPVEQSGEKKENVRANLFAAAKDEQLSDDFVLMNDDFFIMKPLDALPNLNFGTMRDVIAHYHSRYPEITPYMQSMIELYELLKSKGYDEPISYELHVPMVMNKHNIRTLIDDSEGIYSHFRSYYGNVFNVGGEAVPDVKLFLKPVHNNPAYVADPEVYVRAQTFLSGSGITFRDGTLGDFLRNAFPEKSPYER